MLKNGNFLVWDGLQRPQKSKGRAEDELDDEVAKLAKIRPMRVEMFLRNTPARFLKPRRCVS